MRGSAEVGVNLMNSLQQTISLVDARRMTGVSRRPQLPCR
jgi:hypothetical protein